MIHHNEFSKMRLSGLVLVFFLCVACTDTVNSKNSNSDKNEMKFHLLIKSPFSCNNIIQIDGKGTGTIVVGTPNGDQIDSVLGRKEFVISSEKDLKVLKKAVDSIRANQSKKTITMSDSYRFVLTIDNKEVLDTYNQDSFLGEILIILLPYVEEPENGQCNFFNLYRKVYDQYIK